MNPRTSCRVLLFLFCLTLSSLAAEPEWSAGLAALKITPAQPVLLAGYASRTNLSTGVDQDIWAKALALKDQKGNRAVLVTLDLCTFPHSVSERITSRISQETNLRRDQILLALSHTHSGPRLFSDESEQKGLTSEKVEAGTAYTSFLEETVTRVVSQAFDKFEPAQLSFGSGIANIAMNRRESTTNGIILGINPRGLVDRTVPVLRIDSAEGKLRAVLFGYACHGTTLPPNYLRVSGDFAGWAQAGLQEKYPGVQAMFMMGCGGDANPYPRTGVAFAAQNGFALADEVSRVLETKLKPISGPLASALDFATLPLESPSTEDLKGIAEHGPTWQKSIASEMLTQIKNGKTIETTYRAPIAVWQFGNSLTLVCLSNEVVSDYVPLLERSIGPLNLWLSAYGNEVTGYIPSRRILAEGGYEARGLYDGRWFAPGVEGSLIKTTRELAARVGRSPLPSSNE